MKTTRILVSVLALAIGVVGWWLSTRSTTPVAPKREAAATPDCLLPMMVNEGELKAALEANDAGRLVDELSWQPWLSPVGVGYVCDRALGDAVWLTREEVSQIPLDGGRYQDVALQNLDKRIGQMEFVPVGTTGVGTNKLDDVYAASLLLLETPWREMEGREVLVAVPGRGKIFVAPRGPEFERPLKQLAQQAFGVEPNPLVDQVLARVDGGWEWVH